MEWRMSERLTAASSEVKRLLGEETTAATSQTVKSTATTATPTPRAASTWPRWCRRKLTLEYVPSTRPTRPKLKAVAKMRLTMRTDRVRSSWPVWRTAVQTSVPRRNPSRKPPNVRIWTKAPSRRPWTAASSINPMMMMSTKSTVRG